MNIRIPTLLLFSVLALAAGAPAHAQDPSGASASGYAYGSFAIGCTTCPHYEITLSKRRNDRGRTFNFISDRDIGGTRSRAFATDIKDIRTRRCHTFCVGQGQIGFGKAHRGRTDATVVVFRGG